MSEQDAAARAADRIDAECLDAPIDATFDQDRAAQIVREEHAAIHALLDVIDDMRKAELSQNELPIGWHVRIYDAARVLRPDQ